MMHPVVQLSINTKPVSDGAVQIVSVKKQCGWREPGTIDVKKKQNSAAANDPAIVGGEEISKRRFISNLVLFI
jgi:hypothetical protein